ncbi:MAG TPA: hypothetical protein VGE15_13960 [Sphingobacteriaceae bacterium]
MDQTRVHLMISHFPVFGSLFGALVLGYGLWAGSSSTKRSAYIIFTLSAAGALLAYLTGEGAKDTVKSLTETPRNSIRGHRDLALYAVAASAGLGILSLTCLITRFKSRSASHALAVIILLLAWITFAVTAWTGYLGLQIRHTEMQAGLKGEPGKDPAGSPLANRSGSQTGIPPRRLPF